MNIPDYTLLQSCGKGAYGQVWLAQSQTNKLVALKYVANSQAGDREFEGLINYSQLPESPHLIRILHLGKLEDGFFYTMELADGLYSQGSYVPETLAERLKRSKRLPVTEVMELAAAMLSALGTLHEAGMVHRDLKPENILYVNGTPKLSDVGLVRSSEQTVSLGGTLGFIPPERLKPGNSAAYNVSDDLYALGKVLYCALTGNAVEKFPSVPPEMINNTLCCHLNQIILKACGNEDDRFKNTGDFLSQLQNGAEQTVKRELPYKKYIFPAISAILLILLLLVVAKLIFTHSGTDQQQIADQLAAIQQLLQEQKNTPEKKPAEVAVQQTPAQKPSQQKEAAKKQSVPALVKELEEHANSKAVNLKATNQHNPVLHHQPALKTALKHPDMGSVPRRMKKLFPTTQQEQTAENGIASTSGKTLPPFVETKDQKLFSHTLPDEFALRAKLTPNYGFFWNYTFHFAQKQNEKNIFTADLAFFVTTTRGSIILLDNKDPNKNSLFSKTLLYNYYPNAMERDILETSLAIGRSRVSGEHLTPASRKSYNRLINRRSFVLEIVKTKTSCSYYIDQILVATYPLKNQDFKNVFITQDLNKTNVLSEIEIYDITPDPECPPEKAYVLPGHPAWKPEAPPEKQAEQTPPPPRKKTIFEAESNQLKLELRRWKDKERVQIEKQKYTDQEKKFMDLIKKADELKEKHGKKTFIEYSGPTGNTVPAPDLGRIPRRMTKLFPLENAPEDFAYANDNAYAGNLPRNYVIKGYIFFDDRSNQRYLSLHSLRLSFYKVGSDNSYDIDFYIWLSATKGTLLSFQAKDQTGTHTTHLYNHFTNANENYLHRLQEQNLPPRETGIPFELIKMRDNIVLYINDQLIMNVKNENIAEVPSFATDMGGKTFFDPAADNWEIYDITPDPECPPEEAYVLPGHPVWKPAPQKPLQNGSIDAMLDATLQQVLKP